MWHPIQILPSRLLDAGRRFVVLPVAGGGKSDINTHKKLPVDLTIDFTVGGGGRLLLDEFLCSRLESAVN